MLAGDGLEVVGGEVVGDALEGEVVCLVGEDGDGDAGVGEGAEGVVDAGVGFGFEVPAAGVGFPFLHLLPCRPTDGVLLRWDAVT